MVNLICVPSPREFEWMIAHAAAALLEQEAKQQRAALLERKKTLRKLIPEETKEKRVDAADPTHSKDKDGPQPGGGPSKLQLDRESSGKSLKGTILSPKSQKRSPKVGGDSTRKHLKK